MFRFKKALVWVILVLMLTATLDIVKLASAQTPLETIFIQPDGSIWPASAPIERNGNTYSFTGDVVAAVKILRSNIVLDGKGYTLSGPYNGTNSYNFVVGNGPNQLPNGTDVEYVIGVDFGNSSVNSITIENLNIMNFSIGTYLWTQNDTLINCNVSDNIVGVLLSGSNNTVIKNYVANNTQGLFFGFTTGQTPNDVIVTQNAFVHNTVQCSGCKCKAYNMSEPPHNWDNGKLGNYWSDYNGTDTNHEGIGDTPYVIDPVDRDRFPLMQIPVQPPVPASKTSAVPLEMITLAVASSIVIIVIAFAAVKHRRRTNSETSQNYNSHQNQLNG